jgi:hypothetical protein
MVKIPKKHGMVWSQAEISSMRTLAKGNISVEEIAFKLGRSVKSIESKARIEGISLKKIQ